MAGADGDSERSFAIAAGRADQSPVERPTVNQDNVTPDPWSPLRRHTAARIALGRAGGSLPTAELLRFSQDHAEARDAVYAELNLDELEASLAGLNLPIVRVGTLAADRPTYLRRPDLGRTLGEPSRARLKTTAAGFDVAIVVADGLSAQAARRYAAPLLAELLPSLRSAGYSLAPIALATQARVALQDDIGSILSARSSIILLGERPGLHAPISLGGYLVYAPKVGATDERRNCISNIRAEGLSPTAAAHALLYLLTQSLTRRLSGVNLKDERCPATLPSGQ